MATFSIPVSTYTEYGPTSDNPPGGLIYDTGQLPETVASFYIDCAQYLNGYQGASALVRVYFLDRNNVTIVRSQTINNFGTTGSPPVRQSFIGPPNTTRLKFYYETAFPAPGTTFGVTYGTMTISGQITGTGTNPYCPYGTQLQPSKAGAITITADVIAAALSALGGDFPVLQTVFDNFIGQVVQTLPLCQGPPPAMPTFTADDFLAGQPGIPNPASIPKWWQGIQAVLWSFYCECVPGSGTVTPYPNPTFTPPPNVPTGPPTLTCSNTDLCTALNSINQLLTAMSGQVGQLRNDVTLIQRQNVPFAYILGTSHNGLSGSGDFPVQGLLGLVVQLTTLSQYQGSEAGDPRAYSNVGWISIGTGSGWIRRYRLSDNPELILPMDMGAMTQVGYTFEPGIVANIVEVQREP